MLSEGKCSRLDSTCLSSFELALHTGQTDFDSCLSYSSAFVLLGSTSSKRLLLQRQDFDEELGPFIDRLCRKRLLRAQQN